MTLKSDIPLQSKFYALFLLIALFGIVSGELMTNITKMHYGEPWAVYVNPNDETDVHLFKAFPGRVNFPNALENCKNYGSQLASFRSPREYVFIKELVQAVLPNNSPRSLDYWTGIYHRGGPKPVDVIRDAKLYFTDNTPHVHWKIPELYHITMVFVNGEYAPAVNLSLPTDIGSDDKQNMTVYCVDYKAVPVSYSKHYPIEKQEFIVDVFNVDCRARLLAHVCKIEAGKADSDGRPVRPWVVPTVGPTATTAEGHVWMVESGHGETGNIQKPEIAHGIATTQAVIPTSNHDVLLTSMDKNLPMVVQENRDGQGNTTSLVQDASSSGILNGTDLRHNDNTKVEKTKRNITSELFNGRLYLNSILAVTLLMAVLILICVGLCCCYLFKKPKSGNYYLDPPKSGRLQIATTYSGSTNMPVIMTETCDRAEKHTPYEACGECIDF
ncbi:hypothetical protein DdX_06765 [Ditylenchus destructor]|uniref:C-type lectin domain-containing protein n=1 Tax=Ditylenchus destructor TaxID=166010 RepID=A0AAD4N6K8_9BILA|nr:hypothetical protein DdX_06765 [Ditylenchus destructor]